MTVRDLSVETPTHGRVLVRRTTSGVVSAVTLVGFHGYAQSAEDMMDVLAGVPGSDAWTLVSIQALNRFYTRGDQKIVASWMTRQDRELTITDNVVYIDRALEAAENDIGCRFSETTPDVVFVGFSQGVAMAYRAALLGKRQAAGIIAIGGDVPPDVKDVPAERWPRVLIAAAAKDHWYTPKKVAADEAFLQTHGVAHDICRYDAGHEITAAVLEAAARFLAAAGR